MRRKPSINRYRRLWSKFRRDPVRYFVDSHSTLLRIAGVPIVHALQGGAGTQLIPVYAAYDARRTRRHGILAYETQRIYSNFETEGRWDTPRRAGRLQRIASATADFAGRLLIAVWRSLSPRTCTFEPIPDGRVRREGDLFVSDEEDPSFVLGRDTAPVRPGWVTIRFEFQVDSGIAAPVLYLDLGHGFHEPGRVRLPLPEDGVCHVLMRLPAMVHQFRFDPMEKGGRFRLSSFTVREISPLGAVRFLCGRRNLPLLTCIEEIFSRSRVQPNAELESAESYASWIENDDTLTEVDLSAIRRHIASLRTRPLITVITPVYNTERKHLREMLASVRGQVYENWELCIVNDGSSRPHVRKILDEECEDARIRVLHRDVNKGITVATNEALATARGELVVFLDHDDKLSAHALYMVAAYAEWNPEAALFYSDSDAIDENGHRYNPFFKPDWNYELLLGMNYLNHLCAYRRTLLERIGGVPAGFDGSQDYALNLLAAEQLSDEAIVHIPFILYHWRNVPHSFSYVSRRRCTDAARRAISAHLARRGEHARVISNPHRPHYHRVVRELTDEPAVTAIIPTRDRLKLLSGCVDGLLRDTAYRNLRVLIVDNDSRSPKTLAYLERIGRKSRVRVIHSPGPFNFSQLNNEAVKHTEDEILAFLNNDIEIFNPHWLTEMVSHIQRPGIGAVGAKLYYRSNTIQHAGVVLGIQGVAGHIYKHRPRRDSGHNARLIVAQEVTAVTGACMLTRRSVFQALGGFDDTHLAIAFNDIDYCLRLREAGYKVIWTPFAELYHLESASRGLEDTPEKSARFGAEIRYMRRRWGERLTNDPYYNPNLSLRSEDYQIAASPRVEKPWNYAGFPAAPDDRRASELTA